MKKYVAGALALCSVLMLVSWGFKGHQAVGAIAENHLTTQAKAAVRELLGRFTSLRAQARTSLRSPAFARRCNRRALCLRSARAGG